MSKWHIKITLECQETENFAIFDVDMGDKKSVNFDLDMYDVEKASSLLSSAFVWIIDMLWLREKFLKEMQEIMSRN